MKLRTRLTLGSAIVTAVSTLLIGGYAIISSHDSAIALVDQSLDQVAVSVHGQSNDALSQALFAVQTSNASMTLVHFSADRVATVLVDSTLKVTPNPSLIELRRALSRPQTIAGTESYRMRTVQLPDKEFIIVASSLLGIDAGFQTDVEHLVAFILVCLLLASLATWLLMRRDVKKIEDLIDSATEISNGDTSHEVSVSTGDSEVDQLGVALNRMVISLRRTVEVEERAARRMQEFIGDASHELRTPLTVIKGYVELLSGVRMTDPVQRDRAYVRVNSEIVRMESLISDILFLAEFGESRITEPETFDLSELVNAHLVDFIKMNSSRNVISEVGEKIDIDGMKAHMARLLTNAFGNISRHTPDDAPVRVTLKKVHTGVELDVEDGGPGLSDDVYHDGIQSFQRFDRSRSREDGGSGLGMSIIFTIVREHGGSVSLRKSDLGGLALHVRL
ncbi:MAG TPA: HAMP domain-containing sensor histidine kinase [Candidatus Nanopelagicaceae bacterium]